VSLRDPNRRHEFVLLFDVTNGNPNGDPDAGNLPRIDPETGCGLVTDVCLKRKIRNYVADTSGQALFIQSRSSLNALIGEAGAKLGVGQDKRPNEAVRDQMCRDYYDIRMFGAVLSTGDLNAGQVRGPAQMSFARSLDPIFPLDLTITRGARTTQERMETGETEMGRKPIVPYGLYRGHGYFNPFLAEQTGVTEGDLGLFWEALAHMFEFDRSATRGEMAVQQLCAFTHENKKGNASAHHLFSCVNAHRVDDSRSPRAFSDYRIEIGEVPTGVTLTSIVDRGVVDFASLG
jgi:CRISPR-associated protein Csd2